MGNTWFQFQEFRVVQEKSAMKISTDAILLGALAEGEKARKILDIGTGTGVIALMLAQRFENAELVAVELDEEAAAEAKSNFENSRFQSRIELWQGQIQDFQSEENFELIVSNPPFFPDHLKSSNAKRNQALHTDRLSFEELAKTIDQLLSAEGQAWIILPPRQMGELEEEFLKFGFSLQKEFSVRDNPSKPIHRKVSCFSRTPKNAEKMEFSLKDPNGQYSVFYKGLLSGFLLGY
ncbi:tRNA1(Val) (adenine(37)-N6)-methyltransferase [Algoriphagus vanfongensis]|uniref:tRNA1(Val) (adenine(37)-N6)-methyltransferase n=1 Tax=Algoriphagus vanfongensis TaxID=426371 RepID=UPI000404BA30|nr:methyltransferase [Algoriphagus vanfongensis]